MKFLLADLEESIIWGEHWLEKDIVHIKAGQWDQEGKQQYRDIVFKYQGKCYTYTQCRGKNGKDEWEYVNIYDVENGYIKCAEFQK